MSYAVPAPDAWTGDAWPGGEWPGDEDGSPGNVLAEDQCVIGGEHYFIRGLIEIPVLDGEPGDVFSWNVWCSLSEKNFDRAQELWETPGRESEPPYFSWVSNDVGIYEPATLNLKAMVHTREIGRRPFVELEPTDHPLAVEQRTGITLDRVRAIAQRVMHGDG